MFLSYADESGYNGSSFNPAQPVQAMAAMLPNVYNFHRSDSEFTEIFEIINERIPIDEIKAEQIYRGRGSWANVQPDVRDRVIDFYLRWIASRNHKLIVTAIDNRAYFDLYAADSGTQFMITLPCPYLLAGLQTALVIQKLNRTKKKNKGKTLLVFDEQEEFSADLPTLIFDPPPFVDEFVQFDPKKEKTRLNQIVDTAFFVKSHHSSMAQVVDVVAYLVRLKLELASYGMPEAYHGELAKVEAWLQRIEIKFVPMKTVYPKAKKPFLEFIRSTRARGF